MTERKIRTYALRRTSRYLHAALVGSSYGKTNIHSGPNPWGDIKSGGRHENRTGFVCCWIDVFGMVGIGTDRNIEGWRDN